MTQQITFHRTAAAAYELARMIEAKDPYTAGHTWRVANYAQILAAALDYPPDRVEAVVLAGTLHDIGKLFMPDAILTKPGRLTSEEMAILRRHPIDGCALLQNIPGLDDVLDVVLLHHEAYDGGGYPHGIAGQAIPHQARLFAVVDAFDAMTSTRCYRTALTASAAVGEIERNLGRQFDPQIGMTFINLQQAGLVDHIVGHSDYGVQVGGCPNCGPVLEMHNGGNLRDSVICPVCRVHFRVLCTAHGDLHLVPDAGPQMSSSQV